MRYKSSYQQQREAEEAARTACGLISERYAGIAGIEFHMTYYHRASVLMERTLHFSPKNHASFHMRCQQDGCTGGGYDLAPVVAGLAKSRKRSAKGTIFCHGSAGSVGHGSIAYKVTIQYRQPGA